MIKLSWSGNASQTFPALLFRKKSRIRAMVKFRLITPYASNVLPNNLNLFQLKRTYKWVSYFFLSINAQAVLVCNPFSLKKLIDYKMYAKEKVLAPFKHLNMGFEVAKLEGNNSVIVLTFADLNMQM